MAKISTDIKPSFETLIQKFKNHGFHFSEFMLQCDDSCLPIDIEWNYKDIAHVPFLHNHAIREFTYISNKEMPCTKNDNGIFLNVSALNEEALKDIHHMIYHIVF